MQKRRGRTANLSLFSSCLSPWSSIFRKVARQNFFSLRSWLCLSLVLFFCPVPARAAEIMCNFLYTDTVQTFTAPAAGKYKLEVWGAAGGYSGGKGGYSVGYIQLSAGEILYVYVGGVGRSNGINASNGSRRYGNYSEYGTGGSGSYNSGGGGAGTEISLRNSEKYPDDWYRYTLIAAGGGGGGGGISLKDNGNNNIIPYSGGEGGAGGGSIGERGNMAESSTGGYNGGSGANSYIRKPRDNNAYYSSNGGGGGGGGGGWNSGFSGAEGYINYDYAAYSGGGGGGGGNGFVLTSSSALYQLDVPDSYYLTNASMLPGNANMPNPDSANETMVGRAGDGFARITYIDDNAGQTTSALQTVGWVNQNIYTFNWAAVADDSGIDHYDIHWSQTEGSEVTHTTDATSFSASGPANGIYYLRVRAVDGAGNIGAWKTIYIYKYDGSAPGQSASGEDRAWSNNNRPSFTWVPAVDTGGSGIRGYNIYWGDSSSGAGSTLQTAVSWTAPANLTSAGVYYLRAQAVDNAGNVGEWKTVLTYRFDNTSPSVPGGGAEIGYTNNTDPAPFVWSESTDTGSGVKGYYIYWGTSSVGTGTIFQSGNDAAARTYDPPELSADGIYYLRVQAVDNAGNTSAWATVLTYRLDVTKPSGPAAASPGVWTGQRYVPDGSWAAATDGSGVDGYYMYWGKNPLGESLTVYQSARTYASLACDEGDGVYYLRVRPRDKAGNLGDWVSVLIYRYDNNAPAVTDTQDTAGWTNVSAIADKQWTASADGGGSGVKGYFTYWGLLSNGEDYSAGRFKTGNSSGALSASSSGVWYLRVAAIDNAGNTSNWTTVLTYRYDNTAPGAVGGALAVIDWNNNAAPEFSWNTAADETGGSGIAGYNVYFGVLSGGEPTAAEITYRAGDTVAERIFKPAALSASNVYHLRLQAVDNAGNKGAWKNLAEYRFDNTRPGSPAAAPPNAVWHNSPYVPAGGWTAATDGDSGIDGYYIYWGKGAPSDAQTVWQTTASHSGLFCGDGDGTYKLYARAKDQAGNLAADWTVVLIYNFDTTPPGSSATDQNIPWTNAAQAPAFSWSVAPDGTGSGTAGYYIYWGKLADGQSAAPYVTAAEYTPPVCADEGVYYLRIRPGDVAGNEGAWQTVAVYHYDATEPGSSPSFEDGVWTNIKKPDSFIWEEASDGSGSGIDGYSYNWSQNAANTALSGYRQGNTLEARTYIFTTVAADGTYYLRVRARDAAGNDGAWKTVYIYRYDGTAPGMSPTGRIQDWTAVRNAGAVTWDAAADAGGSGVRGYYRYWGADNNGKNLTDFKNGDTDADRTYSPPPCSVSGVYYLRVAAVDNAGNVGDWQTVLTYQYDAAPPVNSAENFIEYWSSNNNDRGAYSWTEPSDYPGSGVAGYNIYWGTNSVGTGADFVAGNTYDPPVCDSTATYYLRVQAVDRVGNAANWITVLTYIYSDNNMPGISPTFVQDEWSSASSRESLTWAAAPDGGYKVIKYYYYWGKNSAGSSADFYKNGNTDLDRQTGQLFFSEGDGVYYYRVRAEDESGQKGDWTTVLIHPYDKTAPILTDEPLVENWTAERKRAYFAWSEALDSSAGIAGYNVYWGNNSSGVAADFQIDTYFEPPELTTDGLYYLRVQPVDHAGNKGSFRTLLTYKLDTTPPDFFDEPLNEPWTREPRRSAPFTWEEALDGIGLNAGSGVAAYNIYWGDDPDGSTAQLYRPASNRTYTPPACKTGDPHYLRIQAVDSVGNVSEWRTVLIYNYDNIAPGISPTDVVEGWTNVADRASFSWDAASDGRGSGVNGYYVYWGSDPEGRSDLYQAGELSYNPPPVTNGVGLYYLRVRAVDNVGLPGEWTTALTYLYEDLPPTGSAHLAGNVPDYTNTLNARLLLQYGDLHSGVASMNIDSGAGWLGWEPVTAARDILLTSGDGEKIVTVQYHDFAGNDSSLVTASIILDTVTPGISATAVTESWTNTADRTVFFWSPAADNTLSGLVGYSVYWGDDPDGASDNYQSGAALSFDPPTLNVPGVYYLRVQAVSLAENYGDWATVLTYQYAGQPPEMVSADAAEIFTSRNTHEIFTWPKAVDVDGDLDGYYICWTTGNSGVSTANYQTDNFIELPEAAADGVYYLRVQPVDIYANAGEWRTVLLLTYDTSPPTGSLRINSADTEYTGTANVYLDFQYSDPLSGVVSLNVQNGGVWQGWEPVSAGRNILLPPGDGEKTVTVQYRDAAGNLSVEYSARIILDTALPAITLPPEDEPLEIISTDDAQDAERIVTWNNSDADSTDGYYIYFGTDPQGISTYFQETSSFNIPALTRTGAYYLRAQVRLKSGIRGEWTTLKIYQYTAPDTGTSPDNNGVSQPSGSYVSGSGGTGEKVWSYPNPFSPDNGQEAHIAYVVAKDGWTKVYVYDARGRRVWQTENYARADADNIVLWDGRNNRGQLAANGLYIIIVTTEKNQIISRGRLALYDE
jgi:hypothetical protein